MIKANLDEHMVNLADFAFSDSQKYESTETVAAWRLSSKPETLIALSSLMTSN